MTRSSRIAALTLLLLLAAAVAPLAADAYEGLRRRMVEEQLRAREITDERVLAAMAEVPRHLFVPEALRDQAYADRPLPIGHGQNIYQPYVVGLMSSLLELDTDDRVLEIGTGSGYHSAVLSRVAGEVYSVEIIEPLGRAAEATLGRLGYEDVHVRIGDGYQGWTEKAPFDAILLNAAPPRIPRPLIDQLAVGGTMVVPVGGYFQNLLVLTKTGEGAEELEKRQVGPVRVSPMTGEGLREGEPETSNRTEEVRSGDGGGGWAPSSLLGSFLLALGLSPGEEEGLPRARERMVERQLEARGISDPTVLAAMRQVPRHRFVPSEYADEAYQDHPLPIGHHQTISQPYVVALMTSLLELGPEARVLEIGTGSGYHAAVLSRVAGEVFTIEIVEELGRGAERTLAELGYDNVHVRIGDGYRGWPEAQPFDGIVLTAAPPRVPEPLLAQLAVGGRMVLPVGDYFQELKVIRRTREGFETEPVLSVRFVPMTGEVQEERRQR